MRTGGNFSPEWGYLAPAPSFMRTARVVIVATAVGATAGAAVVLSLADRPAADAGKTAVAAHAIVTAVQASPVAGVALSNVAPVAAATVPANITAAPKPAPAPIGIAIIQPQISGPASVQAATSPVRAQPVAASVPAASNVAPVSAPRSAPGIAALTDTAPSADQVTSDATDLTIAAPEPAPGLPQRKTKHAAGPNGADSKHKPTSGFGVLQRLFSSSAGKPSVH
jgi:hypothetical protein